MSKVRFYCALLLAALVPSARAENLWQYDSAGGIISNVVDQGYVWNVPVTWSPATGALTVKGGIVLTSAPEGETAGELDLRGVTIRAGENDEPVAVTSLSTAAAFLSGKTNVKALFADSVKTVGARSFRNNKVIQDLRLAGEQINFVYDYYNMAGGCTELTNAVLDCPMTSISSGFFGGCSILSVDIATIVGKDFKSIGDQAFLDTKVYGRLECTNLTYIGASAFCGTKLQEVELHGPVTSLPTSPSNNGGVFQSCTSLTNIWLDFPLTFIGKAAFSGCTALVCDIATLLLPSVRTVDYGDFQECYQIYGSAVVTNLSAIPNRSFKGCGISELIVTGTVKTIGGDAWENAMGYMAKLTNLVLNCPGFQAFNEYALYAPTTTKRLASILIGSTNAVVIQGYAFYNQSALQSVRFHGPAPTLESLNNLVKYVPSRGSSDAKQTTIYASKHQEGWRSDTILDAVTEEERALWIAANPLENPSNLRGVLKRDASQASKAWIVHAGSPFDKKVNTLLLVR